MGYCGGMPGTFKSNVNSQLKSVPCCHHCTLHSDVEDRFCVLNYFLAKNSGTLGCDVEQDLFPGKTPVRVTVSWYHCLLH